MSDKHTSVNDLLRALSVQDFLHIGVDQIAYIRPITMEDNRPGFAVFAADGKPLSVMDTFATAVTMIRQNEMHPVTLH